MRKFTFSAPLIELFKENKGFSLISGMKQLTSSEVRETRLGNKFIYHLSDEYRDINNKIATYLNDNYFSKIPVNQSATAYLSGKSYLNFLEPHRNNFFFTRIDLKNFFHSIPKNVIISCLGDYFSGGTFSEEINQTHLNMLYNFVSIKIVNDSKNKTFHGEEILPMGFPLSPVISNIVFRKIDILIEKLCASNNITYTRYADDLLFSSRGILLPYNPFLNEKYKKPFIHSKRFIEDISRTLAIDGYKINENKNIFSVHTLSLNGYTIVGSNDSDINGIIRVSNKKTKIIEKLIHEVEMKRNDQEIFMKCFGSEIPIPKYRRKTVDFLKKYCKGQIDNKLIGYRSYLISLLKFHKKYDCFDVNAILKYEKIILSLNNIILKRGV